jgi:hypothetical protein
LTGRHAGVLAGHEPQRDSRAGSNDPQPELRGLVLGEELQVVELVSDCHHPSP